MKKNILLIMLCAILALSMVGCNASNKEEKTDEKKENITKEESNSEVDVIRWVRGHAGNPMMSMARENGYLDEYGIKVEEIPMQTTKDSFAALSSDKIDIISNAGTGTPLQYIASGEDVAIFGGHMVSGSVKLIGPPDAKFDGVEDLIGKTVAAGPQSFQLSGPLIDKGHDPVKDVNWVSMEAADTIAAVVKGEIDYGMVGTEMTQKIYEMEKQGTLKVLIDSNELVKNYSCCRMETNSKFIKDNPETTKKLLKALIRGQKDFVDNPEKAVDLISKEIDSPKDFVEAYTYDPGYILHVDPLYNSCVRAWDWFDKMGLLDENAKNINLKDYIYVDIYKEALDEVIEEVGEEDPEYWKTVVKYFEDNNSLYYN